MSREARGRRGTRRSTLSLCPTVPCSQAPGLVLVRRCSVCAVHSAPRQRGEGLVLASVVLLCSGGPEAQKWAPCRPGGLGSEQGVPTPEPRLTGLHRTRSGHSPRVTGQEWNQTLSTQMGRRGSNLWGGGAVVGRWTDHRSGREEACYKSQGPEDEFLGE